MGENLISSLKFLISSIPLFEAPSISKTSKFLYSVISSHIVHLLHGFPFFESLQLSPLARIRAVVVFPTPRGPVNIYPCPTRSFLKALTRVFVTCSCPTTSKKFCGRYFSDKTL